MSSNAAALFSALSREVHKHHQRVPGYAGCHSLPFPCEWRIIIELMHPAGFVKLTNTFVPVIATLEILCTFLCLFQVSLHLVLSAY